MSQTGACPKLVHTRDLRHPGTPVHGGPYRAFVTVYVTGVTHSLCASPGAPETERAPSRLGQLSFSLSSSELPPVASYSSVLHILSYSISHHIHRSHASLTSLCCATGSCARPLILCRIRNAPGRGDGVRNGTLATCDERERSIERRIADDINGGMTTVARRG